MADTPQSLSDCLRDEGGRVVDFFNRLTDKQWITPVYPIEVSWDFHNLLAHFVASEVARKELIVNILAGGRGAPPRFDIDEFNRQEVDRFSAESKDYLLELFQLERAHLVNIISGLSNTDLELIGNDPYLGEVQLAEMIKLTYRHLQIHLREARRCF
jgi:hypothetical protein